MQITLFQGTTLIFTPQFLTGGLTELSITLDAGSAIDIGVGEIFAFPGDFADTIINSGGSIKNAVDMGNGDDTLNTGGGIPNGVDMGEGDDTLRNAGGAIGGVSMGSGNDLLTNFSGSLGDVATGDGNDIFFNAGILSGLGRVGNISMGNGDDVLRNQTGGLIQGDVDMGDGHAFMWNDGSLQGNVTTGSSDDSFLNDGFYQGIVTMGDGNDTLISTGSLLGQVNMGAGDDYVAIDATSKLVSGISIGLSVFLGDGNDTFVSSSAGTAAVGGAGDDTYYLGNSDIAVLELAGQGRDQIFASVSYTLLAGSEVELLWAVGSAGLTLTGNELDNGIVGGGGHDTLNGGGGNDVMASQGLSDVMAGGTGDDIYYVNNSADVVTEKVGEGHDQVFATVDYTLTAGSEVEILWASAGATGLTLTGNELDNGIVGGAGNDLLNGEGGNDTLVGQGFADVMAGGTGDDTYYVRSGDDVIEQAGQGFDKVITSGNYFLQNGSEVEWLQAGAGSIGILLRGNEFSNSIVGGDGADHLDGARGADFLFGGAGDDVFTFRIGEANGDTVVDFTAGDRLDFFDYGVGGALTEIGNTDSYLITPDAAHGGSAAAETIRISNVFGLTALDFFFYDDPQIGGLTVTTVKITPPPFDLHFL